MKRFRSLINSNSALDIASTVFIVVVVGVLIGSIIVLAANATAMPPSVTQTESGPALRPFTLDDEAVGYASGGSVYRVIDTEAGVVCWSKANGLSCLPISDTLLDTGR